MNTDTDDVYFAANFPGQPPMAYHLNTKAQEPGKAPSGMMGHDGSVVNMKNFPGFNQGKEPFARPGATPPKSMDSRFINERAMDFNGPADGGGGANPMAHILGQIKSSVKIDKNKAPDAAALESVKKKANIIFIRPNILKFVPNDIKKGTAKLYFDPKTNLPQTMAVSDPEKGMNANIRFSNWKLNTKVNTGLALGRMKYQEFTADAFGKLFGAFSAFSGGQSGPTLPPDGSTSGPKWMNITKPEDDDRNGSSAKPIGGANPFGGGANPFGDGANPFGGGANPFGGGANPFGGSNLGGKNSGSGAVDMKDAQRSLSDGMKGLSEMMKKLSDPKFQKSMQGFSRSMQDLGKSMEGMNSNMGATNQPKMPKLPKNFGTGGAQSQADSDAQMKAAEEAQKSIQRMMQKFNSPEFRKMMQQSGEAAKQLQKSLQENANDGR